LYRDIVKQFYIAFQIVYLRKNKNLNKVYHFLLEALFAVINIYLHKKIVMDRKVGAVKGCTGGGALRQD
jgi:hypothetical protein